MSNDNRDNYDLWSSCYDDYANPTVAIDDANFPRFWTHIADRAVLEIGAGTGRHTARLVAQGNRVTALDLSPGMLAVARKKPVLKNVSFIEADFLHWEGTGDVYQAIVMALVLEHVSDLERFFSQAAKYLAAGGELFISEVHPERSRRGKFAHFTHPVTQEDVRFTSIAHDDEKVMAVADRQGFARTADADLIADASLTRIAADWKRYEGTPLVKVWVFRKR